MVYCIYKHNKDVKKMEGSFSSFGYIILIEDMINLHIHFERMSQSIGNIMS